MDFFRQTSIRAMCAHYAGSLGATNQKYGLTWTMLSRGCPTQFHYHSGMEFTAGKKYFSWHQKCLSRIVGSIYPLYHDGEMQKLEHRHLPMKSIFPQPIRDIPVVTIPFLGERLYCSGRERTGCVHRIRKR